MSAADVALDVVRLAVGAWLLARVPRPRRSSQARPPLSIVIPARNEERTLPHLLASLAAETTPADEVIVVDDHSDDGTAAIARDRGSTVIAAPPLPDGWTGKTWACHTGAEAARHPTLLFLDADVVVEPGGLDAVAGELHRRRGLVSVQPYAVTPRPYERLSAFFNLVAMMGTGAFMPVRRAAVGAAFGPVMATAAEDYRRAGGHQGVAGEVVEDVALAGRYRRAGLPVSLFGGRGVARFRMYGGGLGSLVEGWGKNFAFGAAATPALLVLAVAAWISVCIEAAVGSLWLYAAVVVELWWMLRRIGSFGPIVALAFPIPLAFFLVLFLWAVVQAARGQVSWRGRKIVRRK